MVCNVQTRKKTSRTVFGLTKVLSDNDLPTYDDVIKFYFWVQNNTQGKNTSKRKETVADITQIVATKVETMGIKTSFLTLSNDRFLPQFLKPFKQRQNQDKYKQMLISLKEEKHSRLFNIATCWTGYWHRTRRHRHIRQPPMAPNLRRCQI